jgi:hypothetical protein
MAEMFAIEKALLESGVPWDAIQRMDKATAVARYKVYTLPFLNTNRGLF